LSARALHLSLTGFRNPAVFIAACLALGGGAYLACESGLPFVIAGAGAHQLAVFLGFSAVPAALIVLTKRRAELGGLDQKFLAGLGLYLCFLGPLVLLIPSNPEYFKGYRMPAPAFAVYMVLTLLQVSTVDFFTKRVVQLEVERAWGPGMGILAQFAAWTGGHVIEYFWLKDLAGPAGAVLFLGMTGALTGALYWKTKNVLGMMAGHWVLNLLLAAAAILYLPA